MFGNASLKFSACFTNVLSFAVSAFKPIDVTFFIGEDEVLKAGEKVAQIIDVIENDGQMFSISEYAIRHPDATVRESSPFFLFFLGLSLS